MLFAICIRRLGLYFVSKIDAESRATSGDFRPLTLTFKTIVLDNGACWEKSDVSWTSNLLRMPLKLGPPQDAPFNPDNWDQLTQHSERIVTLFCGIHFGPHFRFWNIFDIISRRCHSIWQPSESFPVDLVPEKLYVKGNALFGLSMNSCKRTTVTYQHCVLNLVGNFFSRKSHYCECLCIRQLVFFFTCII